MNPVWVRSIGLIGPGLTGFDRSHGVLAGEQAHQPSALPALKSSLLPANERRRVSMTIRLALHVAEEAIAAANGERPVAAAIFASASGDTQIVHAICEALTQPDRPVSPTQFHNSVHNAPAGYWSIATASMAPSTSLSARDETFSAALLDAAVRLVSAQGPVLLVAYDIAPPHPLRAARPIQQPFAVAFVLAPERSAGARAALRLSLAEGEPVTLMDDPGLEALRTDNPAARSLPLLCQLAIGGTGRVALPYLHGDALAVELESC